MAQFKQLGRERVDLLQFFPIQSIAILLASSILNKETCCLCLFLSLSLCVRVCGHVHVYVCWGYMQMPCSAPVCTCIHVGWRRGQRVASKYPEHFVICLWPLVFKPGSLTGLELITQIKLDSQWAPRTHICSMLSCWVLRVDLRYTCLSYHERRDNPLLSICNLKVHLFRNSLSITPRNHLYLCLHIPWYSQVNIWNKIPQYAYYIKY